MAVKQVPNDIIAEQSVLGAMMLSPGAIEKATEKLFASITEKLVHLQINMVYWR